MSWRLWRLNIAKRYKATVPIDYPRFWDSSCEENKMNSIGCYQYGKRVMLEQAHSHTKQHMSHHAQMRQIIAPEYVEGFLDGYGSA